MNILAINGSYRDDGLTDQTVDALLKILDSSGCETEQIHLRNYPIEFCLNCRECMQTPGDLPGQCVHQDGMRALVERIEQADAYILASPTNIGSVTAVFKRFMERLAVYAFWPWGAPAPQFRKAGIKHRKKAVIIASSAAPGLLGRWAFSTTAQLKKTAKTIGADTIGVLFTGFASQNKESQISTKTSQKIHLLADKLCNN